MKEVTIYKEEWKHMGPEVYQFIMHLKSRGHVVLDTLVKGSVPRVDVGSPQQPWDFRMINQHCFKVYKLIFIQKVELSKFEIMLETFIDVF